jgi:hypothetical protein
MGDLLIKSVFAVSTLMFPGAGACRERHLPNPRACCQSLSGDAAIFAAILGSGPLCIAAISNVKYPGHGGIGMERARLLQKAGIAVFWGETFSHVRAMWIGVVHEVPFLLMT